MTLLPERTLSEARGILISDDDRDVPPPDLPSRLSEQYPTESEYERMLDRKLRRRAQQEGRHIYSLDSLMQSLKAMLEDLSTGRHEIGNARWMTGGASKIQVGFMLTGPDGITRSMVLRMEPQESLNATSRLREAQVLSALTDTVPVPEVHWFDEEARWFREPALVYSWMPGVGKPSAATSRIAGIGVNYGRSLRKVLAPQFVRHLAAVHTFKGFKTLTAYQDPGPGTTTALWQINRARRVWEEDRGESMPILDVASAWLIENVVTVDDICLVHGDYRGGNFLFDESSGRITAILDWERSYLGDRHRDLAWTMLPPFGHFDEGGNEFLVAGMMPVDAFLEMYQEETRLDVDPRKLHFYRVLSCYQSAVTAFGSAYRVAKLGRSHQDVVLTRLEATGYVMLNQLGRDLQEVL